MEWLRSKWYFDNCLTVDCVGRGGGLALLWMNEIEAEILSFSNNHIDGSFWRFTGFYGSPEVIHRDQSWDLRRMLNDTNNMPWLCAGDFNEILATDEKMGGSLRPLRQIENFKRVLQDCRFF